MTHKDNIYFSVEGFSRWNAIGMDHLQLNTSELLGGNIIYLLGDFPDLTLINDIIGTFENHDSTCHGIKTCRCIDSYYFLRGKHVHIAADDEPVIHKMIR